MEPPVDGFNSNLRMYVIYIKLSSRYSSPELRLRGMANGETSDMPTPWRHHGAGLGFGNCAPITMPLAPTLGVVIARDQRDSRSASDFNRATLTTPGSSSRTTLTAWPTRRPAHEDMRTQRWILPIVRGAPLSAEDQDARKSAYQPNQPF